MSQNSRRRKPKMVKHRKNKFPTTLGLKLVGIYAAFFTAASTTQTQWPENAKIVYDICVIGSNALFVAGCSCLAVEVLSKTAKKRTTKDIALCGLFGLLIFVVLMNLVKQCFIMFNRVV